MYLRLLFVVAVVALHLFLAIVLFCCHSHTKNVVHSILSRFDVAAIQANNSSFVVFKDDRLKIVPNWHLLLEMLEEPVMIGCYYWDYFKW